MDSTIKVIIAGPRTLTDKEFVWRELDRYLKEQLKEDDVVSILFSDDSSVLPLGEAYAIEKGYDLEKFESSTNIFNEATFVIAFMNHIGFETDMTSLLDKQPDLKNYMIYYRVDEDGKHSAEYHECYKRLYS